MGTVSVLMDSLETDVTSPRDNLALTLVAVCA